MSKRRISPAKGAVKCGSMGCEVFTKDPSGLCSKCRIGANYGAKCVFCEGFGNEEGKRYYCDNHASMFKNGKLVYKMDCAAHVSSVLINDFHRDGVMQVRYSGQGAPEKTRVLETKTLRISPNKNPDMHQEYVTIYQKLFRQIVIFDRELDELFARHTSKLLESDTVRVIDLLAFVTDHEEFESSQAPSSGSESEEPDTASGSGFGLTTPDASEAPIPDAL